MSLGVLCDGSGLCPPNYTVAYWSVTTLACPTHYITFFFKNIRNDRIWNENRQAESVSHHQRLRMSRYRLKSKAFRRRCRRQSKSRQLPDYHICAFFQKVPPSRNSCVSLLCVVCQSKRSSPSEDKQSSRWRLLQHGLLGTLGSTAHKAKRVL